MFGFQKFLFYIDDLETNKNKTKQNKKKKKKN